MRWNRSFRVGSIVHFVRKILYIDARDFYSLKIRTLQIGYFDNQKGCMNRNISCSNLHLMNTLHIDCQMIVCLCPLIYSLFWSDLRFVTWIVKYTRTCVRTSEGEKEKKKIVTHERKHSLSEEKRQDDFSFLNNLHGQHRSQNSSTWGLRCTSFYSLLRY
jgi:hypothetical protein